MIVFYHAHYHAHLKFFNSILWGILHAILQGLVSWVVSWVVHSFQTTWKIKNLTASSQNLGVRFARLMKLEKNMTVLAILNRVGIGFFSSKNEGLI